MKVRKKLFHSPPTLQPKGLRKHHSQRKLFGPFCVVLFAKTRNAVVVCALRAGPFFGTKRNRLVICVLHAVLLERGILWFLCSSHGAFRTRNTLRLCTSHSAFRTRNTQGSSCLCTSHGGFMVKKSP